MELKNDLREDAIANLYRSALYLGRGSEKIGLAFFQKAKEKLGDLIHLEVDKINKKFLAEKVLDEYKRLKFNLPH